MKKKVAIVDYGLGNIVSAQQSFIKGAKENKLNVDVVITNEVETINNSTHIFASKGEKCLIKFEL